MTLAATDLAYPRPRLRRSRWLSLNGQWDFHPGHKISYRDIDWSHKIEVPFPPESPLSGIGEALETSTFWYRRTFTIPADWRSQRVLLHFGAVDYRAEVWVNDNLVVTHEGGHTPFSADITEVLEEVLGDENTLVVRAEDDRAALDQPRGKQDWEREPHHIWYPRTSGIWQSVWLEPVPETYLANLRFEPDFRHLCHWGRSAGFSSPTRTHARA